MVALIFCSLHKNKQRGQGSIGRFTHGVSRKKVLKICFFFHIYLLNLYVFLPDQQSVSTTTASVSTPKVQAVLNPWEIPDECILEGLEFWQTGRYGPICKGLLKRRDDGVSSAVVVKSLRGICHGSRWINMRSSLSFIFLF